MGLIGKKGSDGKPGPRVSFRLLKSFVLCSIYVYLLIKLRVLKGKKVSQDV